MKAEPRQFVIGICCIGFFSILGGCGNFGPVGMPNVPTRPGELLMQGRAGLKLARGKERIIKGDAGPGNMTMELNPAFEKAVLAYARAYFADVKAVEDAPEGSFDYVLEVECENASARAIRQKSFDSMGDAAVSISVSLKARDPKGIVLADLASNTEGRVHGELGFITGGDTFRAAGTKALEEALLALFDKTVQAPRLVAYAQSRKPGNAMVAAERPSFAPVQGDAVPAVKKRTAVIVGISEYLYRGKWGVTNLRYASKDAEAIARYLQSPAGGRFDHVALLTDQKATTRNVRIAMKESLRSAQEDDLIVIFWAGHGSPDPHDTSRLYLITHDADPEHLASTAYPMAEFQADVANVQARRVLVLADACHSAGIADPKIGTRGVDTNKIVETFRGVKVGAAGQESPGGNMRMIFTSCETGEVSRESSDLGDGHGVFTWFLLKGLEGQADKVGNGGNADGDIALGELIEFTRDGVKRFTGNRQHPDTAGVFDRGLFLGKAR